MKEFITDLCIRLIKEYENGFINYSVKTDGVITHSLISHLSCFIEKELLILNKTFSEREFTKSFLNEFIYERQACNKRFRSPIDSELRVAVLRYIKWEINSLIDLIDDLSIFDSIYEAYDFCYESIKHDCEVLEQSCDEGLINQLKNDNEIIDFLDPLASLSNYYLELMERVNY